MSRKWSAIIFIFLGTLTLSSFTFLQRSDPNQDLVFYTEGKHDALWHLALMGALQRSIPPENPLVGDIQLTGYHYFNDALWVFIHILTQISLVTLHLKIAPVVLAGLFTITTLILFHKIFSETRQAFLGASIAVFGAGFAYIAPVFFPESKVGQSVFWLDQTVHLGINQQLLFSLAIVNIILYLFFAGHTRHWKSIAVLSGGVLAIKVYAGLILLGALLMVGIYGWLRHKEVSVLKIFSLALVVAIPFVMLIGNSGRGSPFIWEPGFFFKSMFESGDRLNYPRWELIRLDAMAHQSFHRLIILWGGAIAIFFIGNFGLKILGIVVSGVVIVRSKKSEKTFWQFLLVILCISFAMPTFFLQKGIVWNTIQFLPYAFVPLVLFLVQWIETLAFNSQWKTRMLIVILLLSLPSTIQGFVTDLSPSSYSIIPGELIEEIQNLGEDYPDKKILLHSKLQPESLIPAFAGRSVYFADQAVLRITGNEYEEKRKYIDRVQTGKEACKPDEIFVSLVRESELYIEQCPRKLHTVTSF